MATSSTKEVTQLLLAWSDGDQAALDQIIPLVYGELHRLARRYMQRERVGHTLQTTALINEAYLRLVDWKNVQWQNRAHFFGVAAQLMRRILVDCARPRRYAKRGGKAVQVSFEEVATLSHERGRDLIALDDALKSLVRLDRRKAQIVELRFFGGLSVEETAEVMEVTPRTVMREWTLRELGCIASWDKFRSRASIIDSMVLLKPARDEKITGQCCAGDNLSFV
jgi:RNA polymerase sigma factor (TIGR02999 family)